MVQSAEGRGRFLSCIREVSTNTQALGCDMLQVGSTPDESTSGDYDVIANDLRQLADQAAAQEPPIRMYEALF